jgi:fructose-bisphosphate aldolase class I
MDRIVQLPVKTAAALMEGDKGLIAMDESIPTCNKRFAQFGIPETPDNRRAYRELIVTTPNLGEYISGAILFDETIRQRTSDNRSFIDILVNAGIIPGIKVDAGTTNLAGFPDEKVTEGLDGLKARLEEYAGMGLCFAKWRAVITIGNGIPTEGCISANMHLLARYAALCQEVGMMPIVEPEVLMDGAHSLSDCFDVTERVLHALFRQLYKQRVDIEGMILKPNMILPGKDAAEQHNAVAIADATIKCFRSSVPAAVPAIAFLSGGQSPEEATVHLNEMNRLFRNQVPWALSFSYSRAIQLPALEIWKGNDINKKAAQEALSYRAKCNSMARRGQYA